MRTLSLLTLAAALGAAGCDRTRTPVARQTVVIATAADAESLVPPLAITLTALQVTDLIFEPLADIGPALNTVGDAGFTPRLARAWQWAPDSLSIAFALDPQAHFHDGTPVRAEDVRFSFALYRDPATGASAATELADIDSVTAPDALTAVFWFHRRTAEQFYSAVMPLRILPARQLRNVPPADLARSAFAGAPIGSGPFRFASRTPGSRIELVADSTYHLGRPRIARLVWSVTPDPATAVARLLTGDADVYEAIRPEQLSTVARRPTLTTRSSPGLTTGALLFNLRAPPLSDRRVRRALASALDRTTMVRNVFDTLATVALGPFARAQAAADTTVLQPVYDPVAAGRALDELGWRRSAVDGVRTRAGRRLQFTLIAPASSQARLRYAVLIQEQLRRIGVAVTVEPLEFLVFIERMRERRFDAAVNGRTLEPSARGLREDWSTAAMRAPGGSNYASYSNPAFDAAVDRALTARTPAEAAPWFHRAYQTIVDDAPAVWLFEPRSVLTLQRRLHVVGARPDAWWARLDRWWIEPDAPRP